MKCSVLYSTVHYLYSGDIIVRGYVLYLGMYEFSTVQFQNYSYSKNFQIALYP